MARNKSQTFLPTYKIVLLYNEFHAQQIKYFCTWNPGSGKAILKWLNLINGGYFLTEIKINTERIKFSDKVLFRDVEHCELLRERSTKRQRQSETDWRVLKIVATTLGKNKTWQSKGKNNFEVNFNFWQSFHGSEFVISVIKSFTSQCGTCRRKWRYFRD